MNVKPGDLAIVVKSLFHENIGKICRVIDTDIHSTGLPAWAIEMSSPFVGEWDGGTPLNFKAGICVCPDAWLRPVSGLSDLADVEKSIKEPA